MKTDLIRPIGETIADGAWEGGPAFIIGGGPSLADLDFRRLAGFRTIGINAAMYLNPKPTIAYAADIRFMQMVEEEGSWMTLPSLRVVHDVIRGQAETGMLKPETVAGTFSLPIKRKGGWGRSIVDGGIECGAVAASFSGAVCLNLADILGASPIYLLGFDCYRTKTGANFHDKYPDDWRTADSSYDKFRRTLNAFVAELPDFPDGKVFHLRSPDAPPSGADQIPSLVYDDILPAVAHENINLEATTDACI